MKSFSSTEINYFPGVAASWRVHCLPFMRPTRLGVVSRRPMKRFVATLEMYVLGIGELAGGWGRKGQSLIWDERIISVLNFFMGTQAVKVEMAEYRMSECWRQSRKGSHLMIHKLEDFLIMEMGWTKYQLWAYVSVIFSWVKNRFFSNLVTVKVLPCLGILLIYIASCSAAH